MSEVNEILKKVTASIEEATDKFNARAEDALKEAKKSGKLSEETKAAVDKMASEFNALREAEKTLRAAIGELEQHVAQMPLANAKHIVETVGQQVISAEALKTFSASVEGGKRVSIPVNAALISSGVAEGVVEPQRLPGIDTAPKQRLFTSNPVNPAPGDDLVMAVRDHILPLAPVAGGGLFVFAATEKDIPVTVALAKDTPEIRTAIIAELNALMLRDGAPSGKIYVSRISEAISLATGEVAHQLRVPAADVALGKTELPVLGNITWATYTGENG